MNNNIPHIVGFGRILFFAFVFFALVPNHALSRPACAFYACADRPQREKIAPESYQSVKKRKDDFNFYVLALSWSASFCERKGWAPKQCQSGRNPGFVVHGLWPQYDHGYPKACHALIRPPVHAIKRNINLFPDEGLARHEWRQHGTCSGKSPAGYFEDVSRAKRAINIPDDFIAPSQGRWISPNDILALFYKHNPGLRSGMIAINCPGNQLAEIRLCVSKDIKAFTSCPEVSRKSCRSDMIYIPAAN